MSERLCEECSQPLPDGAGPRQRFHKACVDDRRRKSQRSTPEPRPCEKCGDTFTPYKGDQRVCGKQSCRVELKRETNARKDGRIEPPPLTRRCRNKDCIERFVPQNPQHWFHEPACRLAPVDRQWEVEQILAEEGALTLNASHLELAKSAFGQKNRALRENSRLRSLRDYLTFEVQSFYEENPDYRMPVVPKPPKMDGKKGEREVLVQLSDWQVGKWEDGFGWEGTKARVERLKAAVHSIVQRQRDAGYKVNRVHLSWGGDLVEGCFIYRGQNVTGLDRTSNTHRITRQIQTVAHEMGDFASHVASYVPEVVNHVVGGNHGRPNGPNDYADPEDNFDVMAAWWAEDYVRLNADRIKWDVSENWWGEVVVAGHRGISLHGDQWNGPFSRLETLLPQWVTAGVFGEKPEFVLVHHRHEERQTEIGGIPVFQNGTIDGGSGWYLRSYGRASRPFQRVLTFSEKYVPESQWPVYLQEHPSGAIAA